MGLLSFSVCFFEGSTLIAKAGWSPQPIDDNEDTTKKISLMKNKKITFVCCTRVNLVSDCSFMFRDSFNKHHNDHNASKSHTC